MPPPIATHTSDHANACDRSFGGVTTATIVWYAGEKPAAPMASTNTPTTDTTSTGDRAISNMPLPNSITMKPLNG